MSQSNARSNRPGSAEFPDLRFPDRPASDAEPVGLTSILSQLFHVRGYGRKRADKQLQDIWSQVVDAGIAAQTRASSLKGGILQVAVFNPVLLGELNGFHRGDILNRLKQEFPETRIRDIKFRHQSRK